jgi:hypothetical protein
MKSLLAFARSITYSYAARNTLQPTSREADSTQTTDMASIAGLYRNRFCLENGSLRQCTFENSVSLEPTGYLPLQRQRKWLRSGEAHTPGTCAQ